MSFGTHPNHAGKGIARALSVEAIIGTVRNVGYRFTVDA